MKYLNEHIAAHPGRMLFTTLGLVLVSILSAGWALIVAFDSVEANNRAANVAVCRSVNELRRELYVAAADLDVPQVVRARLLPTQDCEELP